jgi:integrase
VGECGRGEALHHGGARDRGGVLPLLSLQLSPHDLRRTCAKLCRLSGGALEQIQFLLGHASVQTTERYLGGKQELQVAVNDKLGVGLP